MLIFFKLINLFLAALGLRCCTRAFSSCGEWGLFSLLWSTGSRRVGFSSCGTRGLSGCGAWAYLLHGMRDLPGPGLEPMSPALAGRFLTTAPPGKPHRIVLKWPKKITANVNMVNTSRKL